MAIIRLDFRHRVKSALAVVPLRFRVGTLVPAQAEVNRLADQATALRPLVSQVVAIPLDSNLGAVAATFQHHWEFPPTRLR